MDARHWLRNNGYADVAATIDEIMLEWSLAGKKTRRNWWDTLAGGKDGRALCVAGRRFPILKAVQKRQGKAITRNSQSRKRKEKAPPRVQQNRWHQLTIDFSA